MIKRILAKELKTLSKEFPIVVLLGPRQSGKTTLARALFKTYTYVSLEDPDNRQFAIEDPRTFLKQYSNKVILDEIQRVPDLFSYLQTHVDEYNQQGMYVLTGSHNFLLMERISQSLAGRVGISTLLPFSYGELCKKIRRAELDDMLYKGSYPRIYDKNIRPQSFYKSYLNTYIEKDVRLLKNVTNYDLFIKFLRIIAGRTGQIINTQSIAEDCGISHNTVKSWISVLITSYIVFKLQPYFKNYNKRLIKNPKLYFYDTGLVCYLLGLKSAKEVSHYYLRGALFETYVLSELIKYNYNTGERFNFYYWRSNHGKEIDCLAVSGEERKIIEIKSGRTIHSDYLAGIQYWNSIAGKEQYSSYVIYGGEKTQKRSLANIVSYKKILDIFSR